MVVKYNPKVQLIHQLNGLYPNVWGVKLDIIDEVYDRVLDRLDMCFLHVKNKYYHNNNETLFNPLHVAQWTMFLYTIGNEISKAGNLDLCDMIYGLCKMVSSADLFYAVRMPDMWFFDHPQGSVIGRADYSNFFTFSQGCTVGNNKGKYPSLGEHVSMMSNSKILGNCKIGDHVILSANTLVIDKDIPPYSIVFGEGRDVIIKSITK